MMTWYQILSFFFTNGLRIFLGLYLVITLQHLTGNRKKASVISVCAAAFITVLSCFPIQQFYMTGIEIIFVILIAYYLYAAQLRVSLFLIFFYEATVALWEFILSAGLGDRKEEGAVRITNVGEIAALYVFLKKEEGAAVYWEDDYLNILPGEERLIRAEGDLEQAEAEALNLGGGADESSCGN